MKKLLIVLVVTAVAAGVLAAVVIEKTKFPPLSGASGAAGEK